MSGKRYHDGGDAGRPLISPTCETHHYVGDSNSEAHIRVKTPCALARVVKETTEPPRVFGYPHFSQPRVRFASVDALQAPSTLRTKSVINTVLNTQDR